MQQQFSTSMHTHVSDLSLAQLSGTMYTSKKGLGKYTFITTVEKLLCYSLSNNTEKIAINKFYSKFMFLELFLYFILH